MTPQQIELVRSSFSLVVPMADNTARMFYSRLFELDSTLRPLFKNDIAAQGDKLVSMIGVAVGLLDQPERLIPAVQDLGRRHVHYGVEDSHYETVGVALMWTLKNGLGAAFTAEAAAAWSEVYKVLSETMRAAAKQVPRAAV